MRSSATCLLHYIKLHMTSYLRLAKTIIIDDHYNIYFLFQSMIGLMMHCYNLDYSTAALHYINKTLPI